MGSKIGTIVITTNTLNVPHTNTHSKVTTALQRGAAAAAAAAAPTWAGAWAGLSSLGSSESGATRGSWQ
jgi:hypothetical protein